jgi:hypothetical protein
MIKDYPRKTLYDRYNIFPASLQAKTDYRNQIDRWKN